MTERRVALRDHRAFLTRVVPRNLSRGLSLFVPILAFLSLSVTPASAQVGANATITINVLDGLSIFRHSHLRFGERISGTGVHTVAVTSPNVGKFEVVGSRANNVSITLTPPSALANQSGQTLPYTWAAAYNMSADNPGASTPFATTTANGLRLADNSGGYGGNIRRGWVYIHGSIDVGTVPAGNYTAVFSIQAVYN